MGHIRTYCTSSAVGEAVVKVVGGDGDEEEDVGEGMVEVGGEGGGDEKDEGGETQEDYGDKEEYEEEFSEAEISG